MYINCWEILSGRKICRPPLKKLKGLEKLKIIVSVAHFCGFLTGLSIQIRSYSAYPVQISASQYSQKAILKK